MLTSPCEVTRLSPVTTPVVREGSRWVKAESFQTTGTVKYRMVFAKVTAALATGEIRRNTTLVEVTSGSTGLALAGLGRSLGLPVELLIYANMNAVKRDRLLQSGARITIFPPDRPISDLLAEATKRARTANAWHLNQYDRRSVTAAYQGLAQEWVEQLRHGEAPPPEHFVCPVGSGGLIQSLGGALRGTWPGIRVVAVESAPGSRIDGMRNTRTQHLGEQDPYDPRFPDERVEVDAPAGPEQIGGIALGESASACIRLARDRGWGRALILAPD